MSDSSIGTVLAGLTEFAHSLLGVRHWMAQPAAAQSSSAGTVFVGTNGGGLIKRGTGGTWSTVTTVLDVVNVMISPPGLPDIIYIYGSSSGTRGAYKSTDGGANWSAIDNSPSSTNHIQPLPNTDVLYALVNSTDLDLGGIWKSSGGDDWTRTQVVPTYEGSDFGYFCTNNEVEPVTGMQVAPGGRVWFEKKIAWTCKIHYTEDDGASIQHLAEGRLYGRSLQSASTATALYFIISGVSESLFRADTGGLGYGGDHWARAVGVGASKVVGITHEAWGTPSIQRSTDAGTTWTAVGSLPSHNAVIRPDPQLPSNWWIGLVGSTSVYYSTDDALNWSNESIGSNAALSIAVAGYALPYEQTPLGTTFQPYDSVSRDPVNTRTGAFTYARTDVAIPGRGPTPMFTRSYSSADTRAGVLGPGWNHNYEARLVIPSDGPDSTVTLVRPDGGRVRFTLSGSSYVPPSGVDVALVKNSSTSWTVTHKDRTTWTFNGGGRLTSIADRYGNTSTLTYNSAGQLTSVSDPAGRGSLTFTYDSVTGRLEKVSDWLSPSRDVELGYEASSPHRLTSATDRDGKVTSYAYSGGTQRLTTITDANSHVAVTNTYDAQGRVATQKDARGLTTGQQTTFAYLTNPDTTRTTVIRYPATSFDAGWNPIQEDTYDQLGQLIRHVFKPSSPAPSAPTNLALNKPATQSSTWSTAVASRAVDGNTDGHYFHNSVSLTLGDPQAWWQVDLESVQYIGSIDLWNRTDDQIERLADFDVKVSDDGTNWAPYYIASTLYPSVRVPVDRTGRYVKVQLRGTNPIHLAELQVWNTLDTGTNWAVGRTATQSSTYSWYTPERANDGTTIGDANVGSVSITNNDAQAWWQVDLGAIRTINRVDLWNRTDGSSDRLADFDVKVSDDGSSWSSYYVAGPAPTYTPVHVNRTGRYVKVQLRGTNYLQLGEVQVWQTDTLTPPTPGSSDWAIQQYTYDTAGFRTQAMDPRGNITRFCYDVAYDGSAVSGSRGNLTRRIDPPAASGQNRPVTLFQYDAYNNVTQIVPPKGVASGTTPTCSTDFSASSSSTYRADFVFDSPTHAKLESTTRRYTDPDTGSQTATTKYEYTDSNNPGFVTRIIPPRGNTSPSPDYSYATAFAYHSSSSSPTQAGMLQSVTGPATAWSPTGDLTTFTYDAVGRRTSMVDPLGNLTGATAADHTWTYEYDREDRLLKVKTPAPVAPTSGDATRLIDELRYDDVGNRTYVIDANGQITQYLYDERDALEYVKQSPSVWTPGGGGSIPSAPSDTITTKYAYDHLGYLTQVVRAHGDSTYARGVDYLYDGSGRLRQERQYPSWPTLTGPVVTDYAYDAAGNLTLLREPSFQPSGGVSYVYDGLNRLTGINYSDSGTADVSYTYDLHGNRTLMDSGTPDTTYSYDELDRLTSVTVSGSDTVGYRYNLDGDRRRIVYPGSTGSVDYVFEKDGKLASLTDWASRTTSYTYFADGSVKDVTYPNGTKGSFSYDNALRLTEIHHQTTGGTPNTITRHRYTLDKAGNRTRLDEALADIGTVTGGTVAAGAQPNSFAPAALQTTMVRYPASDDGSTIPQFTATIKDASNTTVRTLTSTAGSSFVVWDGKDGSGNIQPAGVYTAQISGQADQTITLTRQASQSYTYDRLYRLTRADNAFGPTSYAYDSLGNRLSATDEMGSVAYAYDKLDRLTQVGSLSYSNDSNGNRTARGSDTFAYDQANRLTQFDPAAGAATDYAYDGDGKRLCKSSSCSSPEFTYDVDRGLPVLLKDSDRLYVWGLSLAYTVDGSSIEVQHSDGVGSVRAISDSSAAVDITYLTHEFGVSKLTRGGTALRLQYTGEVRDAETDFVYLRARMYDPSVGRFLQRDRFVGGLNRPLELHRFSYVENNSINRTDPSGLKSQGLKGCTGASHSGLQLAAMSFAYADCRVVCGALSGCILICGAGSGTSAARPTSEDCDARCEAACEEAWVECEQDAWRRGIPVRGSGCSEGESQCISTGGCFLNPGWRQGGRGAPERPKWEQVWWGRQASCDE